MAPTTPNTPLQHQPPPSDDNPLATLTPHDLTNLATLLHLPPQINPRHTGTYPVSWLISQRKQITHNLPPSSNLLETSRDHLKRIISRAAGLSPPCSAITLCSAHRGLNRHLIAWCMAELRKEWEHHIKVWKGYQGMLRGLDAVSVRVNEFVAGVERVSMLVMGREEFEGMFGGVEMFFGVCRECEDPEGERGRDARLGLGGYKGGLGGFEYVRSRCGACVLAAVGGGGGPGGQILVPLRAAMVFRQRSEGRMPGLLPLVEAWIGRREEDGDAEMVMGESDRMVRWLMLVVEWIAKKKGELAGGEITATRNEGPVCTVRNANRIYRPYRPPVDDCAPDEPTAQPVYPDNGNTGQRGHISPATTQIHPQGGSTSPSEGSPRRVVKRRANGGDLRDAYGRIAVEK